MKTKKILSLILAVLLLLGTMSVTAFAGEAKQLTVNDGTDTNDSLPVYCDFGNCPQHTQFIQPADTLTAIKGGKISKMTFYVASGSGTDATVTVRLMETEAQAIF